jgi:diaminopimelate epimerase
MLINFSKMHGLGNDFVVIDAIRQSVSLDASQIRYLCDRHFGIGCDQLLLIEPASTKETDFNYRIFNADGQEVEQCGNGARCFARYVLDHGLTDKHEISVQTLGGKIQLTVEADGQVTVDMGKPRFEPSALPMHASQRQQSYELDIDGETVSFGAVSMGNPHAVIMVDDVEMAAVEQLGARISNHEFFPNRVNVGFMQLIDAGHIRLRVFERGVGETLACGSGACAAVVIGRQSGLLNDMVTVELPGGRLTIRWQDQNSGVRMTGPAEEVFEGTITL